MEMFAAGSGGLHFPGIILVATSFVQRTIGSGVLSPHNEWGRWQAVHRTAAAGFQTVVFEQHYERTKGK